MEHLDIFLNLAKPAGERCLFESILGKGNLARLFTMRRDKFPVRIWPMRTNGLLTAGNITHERLVDLVLFMGAKLASDLDAETFITSQTEWTEVQAGNKYYYEALVDFNTDAISTAFAGKETLDLRFDIRLQNVDNTQRITYQFPGTLRKNAILGTEGTGGPGDPIFPTPDQILTKTGNLEGLTDPAAARANLGLDTVADIRITVANQAARYALTTAEVQNGDYVFQTDTSVLYEVTDQAALNGAGGYTALATLTWSAITDKPSLFPPESHAHVIGDITDLSGILSPLPSLFDGTGGYTALAVQADTADSLGVYIESDIASLFDGSGGSVLQAQDAVSADSVAGYGASELNSLFDGSGGYVLQAQDAVSADSVASYGALELNSLFDGSGGYVAYAVAASSAETSPLGDSLQNLFTGAGGFVLDCVNATYATYPGTHDSSEIDSLFDGSAGYVYLANQANVSTYAEQSGTGAFNIENTFIDLISGGTPAGRATVADTVTGLNVYTVATLPASSAGAVAYVTDALTPTYLSPVVGGGAVKCPVFHNGTTWVCS